MSEFNEIPQTGTQEGTETNRSAGPDAGTRQYYEVGRRNAMETQSPEVQADEVWNMVLIANRLGFRGAEVIGLQQRKDREEMVLELVVTHLR